MRTLLIRVRNWYIRRRYCADCVGCMAGCMYGAKPRYAKEETA